MPLPSTPYLGVHAGRLILIHSLRESGYLPCEVAVLVTDFSLAVLIALEALWGRERSEIRLTHNTNEGSTVGGGKSVNISHDSG